MGSPGGPRQRYGLGALTGPDHNRLTTMASRARGSGRPTLSRLLPKGQMRPGATPVTRAGGRQRRRTDFSRRGLSTVDAHCLLNLGRVAILLELGDLAALEGPNMAELAVERFARSGVLADIASFNSDNVSDVVEMLWLHGEGGPVPTEFAEEIVHHGIGANPCLPGGLVWMALRLVPLDLGSIAPSTVCRSPRPRASYRPAIIFALLTAPLSERHMSTHPRQKLSVIVCKQQLLTAHHRATATGPLDRSPSMWKRNHAIGTNGAFISHGPRITPEQSSVH